MEIWKVIEGTNGRYSINDNGDVFDNKLNTYPPYSFRDGGVPRKKYSGADRLCVSLCGKLYYVHQLVAKYFVPNPNNLPVVNHKDENYYNNKASNLMWCTYKENSNWGTLPERRKEFARKRGKKIASVDSDGNIVKIFDSISDASRYYNIDLNNISAVLNKRAHKCSDGRYRVRKTAGGYHWKFI